ncbi:spermatogenesis associated 6-like protein isoform X2 [Notolabrus celidotus]|nr:spermatogenesis associated 6-like protein isoform X2 [Notolabrus celidotus]
MSFLGQFSQSKCLPAVFPMLIHEKMMFEKIFKHAVDPGDIAVMLEYEPVRVDLVQLTPPGGETLACLEEDARRFLFPEPKLLPSFSGEDREVLMTRAHHFPGIAPRLEFSSKTTIIECSADAKINVYPNRLLRPLVKRNRNPSSRPRTSSPQRRKGVRTNGSPRSPSHIHRSQSLSPLRAGNRDQDMSSTSQPLIASWPGATGSASPRRSALFTSSSSPLTRSSSTVRYSPTGRRKPLCNGLVRGISDYESSSSETHDPPDPLRGPDPSALWRSYREQSRLSSSHREWEEVQERVRGLLTTPKAVRRLVYGATHSEVDEILARRSISPGPP